VLLLRVADQVVVHELVPVIRMDAQERERDETLATESVREAPELRERREDRRRGDGCPREMHGTCSQRCLRSQGPACGGTVEMRQAHEPVQDPRLLVRGCMKILSSQLLHAGLPFLHSQPHLLTSHLLTLFHCSSSVTCVGVGLLVRQRCDLEYKIDEAIRTFDHHCEGGTLIRLARVKNARWLLVDGDPLIRLARVKNARWLLVDGDPRKRRAHG